MTKRCTTEEFVKKAIVVHGSRYNYSTVCYINTHMKVTIICNIHGPFDQVPVSHLQGVGCAKCAFDNHRTTLLKFIEQSNTIHSDVYDYSEVNYIDTRTRIMIRCKLHGIFIQIPNDHLNGSGCAKCADTKSNTEDFIKKASLVHAAVYDYSEVNYSGAHAKIHINCTLHGSFNQKPISHLLGQGCPKCTSQISKPEMLWLDFHKVPDTLNNRQVRILKNKKFKVDGYDPTTNTVYEFWGDYWHGNPKVFEASVINKTNHKTFGELYEKTMQKRQLILDAGYNLVEIWESDWNEQVKENKLTSSQH